MDGEPQGRDAGEQGGQAVGRRRLAQIDAELVLLLAGGDLGVGQRIDIGVDPERHRRGSPELCRHRAQPMQLRHRFDVDLVDPGGERRFHLRRGLADPGKDDALGRHAGGERAAQLAFRDDVGAGAEAGEQAQHGEVGIGLDRIADERPLGAERAGKAAILSGEGRGRIDIEGRADRRRDASERDLLGVELAAAIGEELTHADTTADR